jgi:hypothetical protein
MLSPLNGFLFMPQASEPTQFCRRFISRGLCGGSHCAILLQPRVLCAASTCVLCLVGLSQSFNVSVSVAASGQGADCLSAC